MKVVVTGAAGFLGWHTRVRLTTVTGPDAGGHAEVIALDRSGFLDDDRLARAVADADVVLHLAGVNRPPADRPDDAEHANVALAERLTAALRSTGSSARVVYSGSTQADTDTPYGRGKRLAGEILLRHGDSSGHSVCEVRLPGLFGEHGRPDYNSFVATFAHRIADGARPEVTGDRELPLLHVQDAASRLLQAAGLELVEGEPLDQAGVVRPAAPALRISWVADRLAAFRECYQQGEIPVLDGPVDVALFNTLRAAMWDHRHEIDLEPRSDPRGRLVEVVRQHGGQGQSFFSTSVPGVRRGDHFHLRKIERFVVVSGQAVIRLRRVLTDDVVEIPVTGERPVAVDMPTLWTHSIENTGPDDLLTLFWVNELFDPADPDTHPEPVIQEPAR